jgi:chemotaxis protein MotB
MPLSRRTGSRMAGSIWPGFVDAMTALLLVLMFVLTIFMIVQSVLRDTITTQDNELDQLNAQVAQLADALGLERARAGELEARSAQLTADLQAAAAEGVQQAALIASLSGQLTQTRDELAAAGLRITDFETQVARLLAERDAARGEAGALGAQLAEAQAAEAALLSEQEALQLALAAARTEIDAATEAARLDAARRDALQALIDDLRRQQAEAQAALSVAQAQGQAATEALTEAERTRLAEAAAAEALRARLANADAELTAMTLALEEERRRAEETLTLLAAAQTAGEQAQTEAERQQALLDTARAVLTEKDREIIESRQQLAALNGQIAALRAQLATLQGLLDASAARDVEARVQIETLGSQLNAALAQVADEQRRRADLEAAERRRLEAEKADLERYRSEFFGQLSRLLAGREGVRVVGDRFVFSSEVLFNPGSADLAAEGQAQIAGVVSILSDIAGDIPAELDWIIRVDGHTDNVPLLGTGEFADNWELSQARALSVVRFMQDVLGFPPDRMAATGFGEYRPVAPGDSPEARAQNRRIELKLTER